MIIKMIINEFKILVKNRDQCKLNNQINKLKKEKYISIIIIKTPNIIKFNINLVFINIKILID